VTPATARLVANGILAAAAVAAGVFILRTPRLRRAAWILARTAVTTTLPAYLVREVRDAWEETGRAC
jgi:hypothetical protein